MYPQANFWYRKVLIAAVASVLCGILPATAGPIFIKFRAQTVEANTGVPNDPAIYSVEVAGSKIVAVGQDACAFQASSGSEWAALEPNKVYTCSFDLLHGIELCNTTVAFEEIPGCMSLYVNGVGGSVQWHYGSFATNELHREFTLELRGDTNASPIVSWTIIDQKGNPTFTVPKEDRYQIPADGVSMAVPHINSGCSDATAKILGDDLGCKMDQFGRIRAGTNTGTIRVRVQADCPTCVVQDVLFDLTQCPGCNSEACADFSGFNVGNGSVDMRFGLGWSTNGESAGTLRIHEAAPKSALTTPGGLRFDFIRPDVFVIRDGNGIRQVKAPEGLANVVVSNSSIYRIEMYLATNVLSQSNGLFLLANQPLRVFTIENVSGDTNRLRMSDSLSGDVFDYFWITNGWRLVSGNNLRYETKTNYWSDGGTVRNETTLIQNGTGDIIFETYKTYKRLHYLKAVEFGSQWFESERIVAEVIGSGPTALTNRFRYVTNLFSGTIEYGSIVLEEAIHSDGSWQFFVYDHFDRPTNIFSGFMNQTLTNDWTLCRLTEHTYPAAAYDDFIIFLTGEVSIPVGDTNRNYMLPNRTVEYLLTNEVARSYTIWTNNQRIDVQCVAPGAGSDAPSNLVTITRFFTNGPRAGEIQSVQHANGTADIFHYGPGTANTTNIFLSGVPDITGTNISDGTRTVIVIGQNGRESSRTVIDVASTLTTSSEVFQYDGLNRLTNTVHLDNTTEQVVYDCCEVGSRIDREGTTTSYTHDALHRKLTVTRAGITTSNAYDVAGNLLKMVRIGTNGSQIVMQENGYDTAGRLLASTNGVGEITLFAEVHGLSGTTNITTRLTNSSSGPQRIETRYLDGQTKSITGGLVRPVRYEYGSTNGGTFTKEIKLDSNGTATSEVVTNVYDMLKRPCKVIYADGAFSQTFYNSIGQASKEVDPDGVTTLYLYNALGERSFTVLDIDRDGAIGWTNDRITWTTNYVVNNGFADVHRSETRVWATNGVNASVVISTNDVAVNGLTNWSAHYGLTSRNETRFLGSGIRYSKSVAPDASFTTTRFENGRVILIARTNGSTQLSRTSFEYDEHGRQKFAIDARNGTNVNTFDNVDRVISTTTPPPDAANSPQTTGYRFDALGRIVTITNADNTLLNKEYFDSGELKKSWGAREYPVEYTYDAQGRVATMKTWREYGNEATAAVTRWTNNPLRGWLDGKGYDDGKGPSYSYTSAGRLRERTWSRGVTTTYATNAAGEIESIDYSDTTPDVTYSYDRLGRRTTIVDGAGTHVLFYELDGRLLSETNTAGLLVGLAMTNGYDALNRRFALGLVGDSSTLVNYGYDGGSRLTGVTNGVNSANYSYVANSPLVSQILFTNGTGAGMMTTKSFDYLNRLTFITNAASASVSENSAFAYAHNNANQRSAITNADGSRWSYAYDSLGQVTNGNKFWSDGTAVLGQQFGYMFDDIGNRRSATSGGNANGRSKRTQVYTANNLNQYTQRTVPGYLDILGTATNTATVTVNHRATSRKGSYYRAEVNPDNSVDPVYLSVTNTAVLASGTNDHVTNRVGNLFVPKTPEVFGYDADGNMTNDGRWSMTWDGENRLIQMESLPNAPIGSSNRLMFVYDQQSRRVSKAVQMFIGGAWSITLSNRFVYDDWNLLVELNATNNAVINSFMWGLDLSGTVHGAGGVGGLLAVTVTNSGAHFVGYDGNGNVAVLVSAMSGTATANYEYDPFGNVLRATGPMALFTPFRFSTKYTDGESGFNFYGYRYHNPSTGRWLSRDPIEETGGRNLYALARNRQNMVVDAFGLYELQYDLSADMSSADREKLEQLITKAGEIAKTFQREAESMLKKGCPCPKAKRELEKLIEVMKKVVSGVMSKSENLEVETKDLGGDYARLKPGGGLFDPILRLNNGRLNWATAGNEALNTIFHELTHIYGTEDNDSKGELMNAETYVRLLDVGGIEISPAYRGLLLDCPKE